MEVIAFIVGGTFAVGLYCLLDAMYKWNKFKAVIGVICFTLGLCGTIQVNRQDERAKTAAKILRGEYSVEYTSSNDTIITLK